MRLPEGFRLSHPSDIVGIIRSTIQCRQRRQCDDIERQKQRNISIMLNYFRLVMSLQGGDLHRRDFGMVWLDSWRAAHGRLRTTYF